MKIEKEQINSDCFTLISNIEKFYDNLSFSAFQYVEIGLRGIKNIDEHILESSKSTLESINFVIEKGHITDAFTLLRKLFDNFIVHIYCTIKIEENVESFSSAKEIEEWVIGKKKLPEMKTMMKYISQYQKMGELWKLLELGDRYRTIRDYCNDNVHNNFFKYLYLNTDYYIDPKIVYKKLDLFKTFLIDLVILHFACLLSIKYHYMSSSDYIDHLEMNMTPPHNCQYWVAPYIQAFFDQIIKRKRKDIADWIMKNTPMELK